MAIKTRISGMIFFAGLVASLPLNAWAIQGFNSSMAINAPSSGSHSGQPSTSGFTNSTSGSIPVLNGNTTVYSPVSSGVQSPVNTIAPVTASTPAPAATPTNSQPSAAAPTAPLEGQKDASGDVVHYKWDGGGNTETPPRVFNDTNQ